MNVSKSLVLFVPILFISCGSYYYAERYYFNLSCDKLIQEINEFTDNNPEFICRQINEKGEEAYKKGMFSHFSDYSSNGKIIYTYSRTDSSIWYSFYFHFSDIKADIHCVINVSKQRADTTTCTLDLTGIT
jgi:hypothetical protein